MRLLQVEQDGEIRLTRRYLSDNDIPKYAILSHTWGEEHEEVTFEDWTEGRARDKKGYKKIMFCGDQAAKDGLQYFWVDSCCIRKTSDEELSTSIRSMFRWYQRAEKCYAYLADVASQRDQQEPWSSTTPAKAFVESRWFSRGWTLQELLAPTSVEFFTQDGTRIGDRISLKEQIHRATGLPIKALMGHPLQQFTVSERKSWAKKRQTTVPEDLVYCLMGLFDVSMAIHYGEGSESASARLDRKINKSTSSVSNEYLQSVLRWLSPPDPSINYHQALKQRQSGTGQWLLRDERYIDWRAGEVPVLWLHGIPGCGKTVLSCTVIEDLLAFVDDSIDAGVAYYYFSFNDATKRVPAFMVCSVLAQLMPRTADVPAVIKNLHDNGANRQPTLDECLNALEETLLKLPHQYLVLDALDECEHRDELMEVLATISKWNMQNLHLLVTSRDERDISDTLRAINAAIIPLQSHVVDPDISIYVEERLSTDRKLAKWHNDRQLSEQIQRVLTEKASGMFRWAACQLDALASCRNRAQLREALSTLPQTLDETYERILCGIPSRDIPIATRVLRWLAFSAEPLELEELAQMVAIDPTREAAVEAAEILEDPLEILDICSTLVTLRVSTLFSEMDSDTGSIMGDEAFQLVGSPVVVFAHYSVQEYLTSRRCMGSQASTFFIGESISHKILSESCMSFLVFGASEEWDTRKRWRIAEYCAENWIYHGANGNRDGGWISRALSLLSDPIAISYWNGTRYPRQTWLSSADTESNPQGLYYASVAGFAELVLPLIETCSQDVNMKGGDHGYAIIAASAHDHREVVEVLIRSGADVNAQGGEFGTALQAASYLGSAETAKMLLSASADVNAQGGKYRNPLQAAFERRSAEMVKILLGAGADIHDQGEAFGGALQAASLRSSLEVVQILLDAGADANMQGGSYGNALQAASDRGSAEIVQMLLGADADVNAHGGAFGTALQAASYRGFTRIVQILIYAGADVNARGGHYGSALQAASANGAAAVMDMLLSAGADVNARGGHYGGALHAASVNGSMAILERLLGAGADVNAQGGVYGDVLQAASVKGHVRAINRLLEAGADVGIKGGYYGSALQAASAQGHLGIVNRLLEAGADVASEGGAYGNALQAAWDTGHMKIVNRLRDAGGRWLSWERGPRLKANIRHGHQQDDSESNCRKRKRPDSS